MAVGMVVVLVVVDGCSTTVAAIEGLALLLKSQVLQEKNDLLVFQRDN
jgi:hypothetical protein